MNVKVKVEIDGKEITLDEARSLYVQLKSIFEKGHSGNSLLDEIRKRKISEPYYPSRTFEIPKPIQFYY